VPTVVLDDVAAQLGIADPSVVKRYTQRRTTRFGHQAEILSVYGYRSFAAAEDELAAWVADRSWTSGDGPTVLFDDAVAWLRQRRVLLPGLSTLVRLVARVREEGRRQLGDDLPLQLAAVGAEQRVMVRGLQCRDQHQRGERADLDRHRLTVALAPT